MPSTQASNLAAEIMASGIPDCGIACFLVGATPSIAVSISVGSTAPAYALTRQPASGTAVVNAASGLFTSAMNVAGLYVCTQTNGGLTRTLNLVAVPSGLLNLNAGSGKVTLNHIQNLLANGGTGGFPPVANWAASVENANFGGSAAAPGGGFGFNPVLFGGTNASASLSFTPYGN
jgi:hypothetical protein